MTLLVVGGSGHLGSELVRRALATGERVVATYRSSLAGADGPGVRWVPLDVRDRAAVRKLVGRLRPRAVINSAAVYADWSVTADGAAGVAAAAAEVGARLVHVSSDAVHGGRAEPYADGESPSPVFPYGAAKAAAETAVRAVDPAAAIVRSSVIVSAVADDVDPGRQVRLCLDALAGRATLFSDEIRCPVEVGDLAGAVLELVDSDHAGPLNAGGSDAVSRAELGLLVARRHGLDPARLAVSTIAASGLVRPARIVLDGALAARVVTTRLRGVREVFAI